jgi:hypothetical protein
MTYTESNRNYVSNTLKTYFREAGLKIPPEKFDHIVNAICDDDNAKVGYKSPTNGDFITQKALTLLDEMSN